MNLFATVPKKWTTREVTKFFRLFNPQRVIIPTNARDGSSRGYAFIDADKAALELDGTMVDGKQITVREAIPYGSRFLSPKRRLATALRGRKGPDENGVLRVGPVMIFPNGQWEWVDPKWDLLEADHDYWKEVGKLYASLPEWLRQP